MLNILLNCRDNTRPTGQLLPKYQSFLIKKVVGLTTLMIATILYVGCSTEPTKSVQTPTAANSTATPTPKLSGTPPLPTGTPISSWKDIPIMPNAITGEELTESGKAIYKYTIKADITSVESFYTKEMLERDWMQGSNSISFFDSDNATSIFLKKKGKKVSETLVISVITVDKAEKLAMVTLRAG